MQENNKEMKNDLITYPFKEPPEFGRTLEVAEGVFWLRMPLPMSLNHINLYLIEGQTGWTVIDTGIRGPETKKYWNEIFENCLGNKPIDQILCTHMHPDHTGQAGFLTSYWNAPLLMSHGEYFQTRVMNTMVRDSSRWETSEHFKLAGISPEYMETMARTQSNFAPDKDDLPIPNSFIRLQDGEEISIGNKLWKIVSGTGHSPEHICLVSDELEVLISGDQVLPVITSNVSVSPTEPFGDPLSGWIESHNKFLTQIGDNMLVLPAHNEPFYGLHFRLRELIDHHEERMAIIIENCKNPKKAVDLLPSLFDRKLEGHSMFMATGECIAHLHCLMKRGRITRVRENDYYYYSTVSNNKASDEEKMANLY
ncbi:MAG: MBL fold metallo-hydrolase [Gammaproteobacteria bacterium]|nr:MBL fold metallo-hydrolase [Gammaproteobacteria bacterium]